MCECDIILPSSNLYPSNGAQGVADILMFMMDRSPGNTDRRFISFLHLHHFVHPKERLLLGCSTSYNSMMIYIYINILHVILLFFMFNRLHAQHISIDTHACSGSHVQQSSRYKRTATLLQKNDSVPMCTCDDITYNAISCHH